MCSGINGGLWRSMVWGTLLGVILPVAAEGRTFLLPPETVPAGETGALLSGAQTSLSAGTEGFFANPAGLAKDTRAQASAGMDLLHYQSLSVDGNRQSQFTPPGVFFALSDSLNPRSNFHTVYGLSIRREPGALYPITLREQRPGNAGSLPAGLTGTTDVDGLFPGGLSVLERSEGEGRLDLLRMGVGFAMSLGASVRVGAQMLLEWLDMSAAGRIVMAYSGQETSATADTVLTGDSWSGLALAGHSTRMALQMGLQANLAPGVEFGAMVRNPSETLRGIGSVSLQRDHQMRVTSTTGTTTTVLVDRAGSANVEGEQVAFRLDSPRELRLGISFKSDWMLFTLEATRVSAQAAYTVFPGSVGTNTLTGAAQMPPLRTSGRGGNSLALGVVMVNGQDSSVLMGWRADRSPVVEEDPLFRKLDMNTVSVGWYRTGGRVTAAMGVMYRQAQQSDLRFSSPAGVAEQNATASVRWEAWSMHLGSTMIF